MKLNEIIKKPIITEKSVQAEGQNKYTFEVGVKASKGAIAEVAAKMFGVEVLDVKTYIMPGKKRRILKSRRFTKTPKWKKAVIEIKKGQKIKLTEETK
ncbi:50S ribosomal protein L23 [Candidatus Nomurabacteria bacterium]|uniref:Large ribosomal subunit protein uL23 n=1 Tax=candidate division WWE3 bacterium TaxID=2053526 RepID=A0A955E193_UNCKA|nr:50S ribosomal protein L23 [candidate division WWE3 bacterium]MCB9823782.1 50S ribosomal protein L23 [Candidatus Nomurabacteria bacterium]MCB9826812.1 50S ribosomal protein L23 [Candidatus Nomurabacteria bacterium]MCB9827577.1 50S ribosomal protein L23 [Candidatus Nomurabacteria bacterium]HXK52936.1 50S ribosomal protein L23 [bacterium]